MGWGCRSATWYTYLRTNRGPLRKWKKRIGKDGECNICMVEETGCHVTFECPVNEDLGWEHIDGVQS